MDKYICVFCDERKTADTAAVTDGKIGICRECEKKLPKTSNSMPFPGTKNISYIMSPFEYKGNIREAIKQFKFHNMSAYAGLLAKLMHGYIDSYDMWNGFDCVIPVPLHEKRLRERGYNQAELICRCAAEYIKVPMHTDILIRSRETKKQSLLKPLERTDNVRGAFLCLRNLKGARVLLFDDICTTGCTLEACAEPLKESGAAKVCAMTLATAEKHNLPVITY